MNLLPVMCDPKGEVTVWPIPGVTLSDKNLRAQYVILKTLGQGVHAQVKLAHHHLTSIPVAIKVLRKEMEQFYTIESEVEILKMKDHPNIVSLIQVIEIEDNIYLVQELAEGKKLWKWIHQDGYMQENTCWKIFKQLLQAMQYCHDRGIIHRDLTPHNIMVDSTGRGTIIDFGHAALLRPGSKLTRFSGALQFIPPEFFLQKPYDGPKADCWNLSIVLYFMATGTVPFKGDSAEEVGPRVLLGEHDIPAHLSPELNDIIRCLLTVKPKERPRVKDILRHPWLQHDEEGLQHDKEGLNNQTEEAPRLVNIDILEAMEQIGFDPYDVLKSLQHKLYNETMATYGLLQCQAHQNGNSTSPDKPVYPGVTLFPSPVDPANVHPCPKRGLDVLTSKIVFSSLNTETPQTSEIFFSSLNTETSEDGQQEERLRSATPEDGQQEERLRSA